MLLRNDAWVIVAGNRMFSFCEDDVDFFLPQLLTLYINMHDVAEATHPYIVYRYTTRHVDCSSNMHTHSSCCYCWCRGCFVQPLSTSLSTVQFPEYAAGVDVGRVWSSASGQRGWLVHTLRTWTNLAGRHRKAWSWERWYCVKNCGQSHSLDIAISYVILVVIISVKPAWTVAAWLQRSQQVMVQLVCPLAMHMAWLALLGPGSD